MTQAELEALVWECEHIDRPDQELYFSLGSRGAERTDYIDFQALVPMYATSKIIRLGHDVSPIPEFVPQALAYAGFVRDAGPLTGSSDFINHWIGCFKTVGYRLGMAQGFIGAKPDTSLIRVYDISTPRFKTVCEYVEGGLLLRLYTPGWVDWCMSIHGAYEVQGQNAMHGLGNDYTSYVDAGPVHPQIATFELGATRLVKHIRIRLRCNVPMAGDAVRCEYQGPGTEWLTFFNPTPPYQTNDAFGAYAGITFPVLTEITGVRVIAINGGTAEVWKPFVWGPI